MQQFEQYTYVLEDYHCLELYPFSSKNKRYFKATKIQLGSDTQDKYQSHRQKSYRLIVYPIQMVHCKQLLEHLQKLKSLQNPYPISSKIVKIKEKTVLVTQGSQLKKQDVIAVFIDQFEQPHPTFYHFYQHLIEYGPYNEKIVRTYAQKLINFISYLRTQGIENGFYPEDLYIEKLCYELRIDNYGDRSFFKAKNPNNAIMADSWQLGNAIFTFFNRFPPYSQTSSTDKFFQLLKNRSYQKFWQKSRRKNKTPQKVQNFLNKCFNQETSWKMIKEDQNWLKVQQILSQNQLFQQMQKIYSQQQAMKLKMYEKNKETRQNYESAIRNRNVANRGSQLQDFLDKYSKKFQIFPRKANLISKNILKYFQMNKNSVILVPAFYDDDTVLYAHIITLLQRLQSKNSDGQIPVCDVQDRNNSVTFRVDGIVDGELQMDMKMSIQVVQLDETKYIKIELHQGTTLQRVWVKKYFERLLIEG